MLICRETPVSYREDAALEDAWHEQVGTLVRVQYIHYTEQREDDNL